MHVRLTLLPWLCQKSLLQNLDLILDGYLIELFHIVHGPMDIFQLWSTSIDIPSLGIQICKVFRTS